MALNPIVYSEKVVRSFCGRGAGDTVCVAASATRIDREKPEAARARARPSWFHSGVRSTRNRESASP